MSDAAAAIQARCPACGATTTCRVGQTVTCGTCARSFRLLDTSGTTILSSEAHAAVTKPPARRYKSSGATALQQAASHTTTTVAQTVCPNCEAVYPSLAKHAGRKIRCKSCQQVLVIQDDGSAKLHQLQAKPEPAPEPDTTSAPPADSEPTPAPEPEPAQASTRRQRPPTETQRTTDVALLKQRVRATSDLDRLAKEALAAVQAPTVGAKVSEAVDVVTQSGMRPVLERPPTTASHARRPGSTPMLVGSGQTAARERRWTLLIFAAGLMVCALIAWLLMPNRGPRHQALEHLITPSGSSLTSSLVADHIRSRCILGPDGADPLTGLHDVQFSATKRIDLAILRDLIGDRQPLVRGRFWVATKQLDQARALLAAAGDIASDAGLASFRAACDKSGVTLTTHGSLIESVTQLPEGAVLASLLEAPPLADKLLDFTIALENPALHSLEVAPFRGSDGLLLLANNRRIAVAYAGFLVRTVTRAGPGDWHLGRLRCR